MCFLKKNQQRGNIVYFLKILFRGTAGCRDHFEVKAEFRFRREKEENDIILGLLLDSAGGFFLLKGSFCFPLSTKLIGGCLIAGFSLLCYYGVFTLTYKTEATVVVILYYINKTELNSNMSLHVATSIFYIPSGVLSLNVWLLKRFLPHRLDYYYIQIIIAPW